MLSKRAKLVGMASLLLAALGCAHEVQQEYPPVPVLVSKKPIEPKTERKDTVVAMEEPALPMPPETALASLPPDLERYIHFVKRSNASNPAGDSSTTPKQAPKTLPDPKSP